MLKPETTPIEESNLAGIGSAEDKACRKRAADLEVNWEGAGESPGIEIWRIENKRNDDGTPNFGINRWPKKKYGKFYRGDSFIVLQTREVNDKLVWDVFFWIGAESSQDEYGVAAYKATELDDFLGGTPIQHREVEGYESDFFVPGCFPRGISYLEGGIDSGFNKIGEEEVEVFKPKLFRIRKKGKVVRNFQVPCSWKSLYHGDAFVLHAEDAIYSWYGDHVSPFEKNAAAVYASQLEQESFSKKKVHVDIGDQFWELLGGKGDISRIRKSDSFEESNDAYPIKMFSISDRFLGLTTSKKEVPVSRENLEEDKAFVVDTGKCVFAWIGKNASRSESKSAMSYATYYLKQNDRPMHTPIIRLMQGQEIYTGFNKAVFGS